MRLKETMNILRETMVEAALRPAEEESRSLLDFLNEDDVEAALAALKESIDQTRVWPQTTLLLRSAS